MSDQSKPTRPTGGRPAPKPVDVAERGGEGQTLDARLWMQLHVFTGCGNQTQTDACGASVRESDDLQAVVYESFDDPAGIAVLTIAPSAENVHQQTRSLLQASPWSDLTPVPDLTMTGRTYAVGYEADLHDTLLEKPIRRLGDEQNQWAIWYPLRRTGAFALLEKDEQKRILGEHGTIGMGYAAGGLASDVRLACYGLDRDDNDFVIGLLGQRLHPLSHLVAAMRATIQTSTYIDRLGPFFIGRKMECSVRAVEPGGGSSR